MALNKNGVFEGEKISSKDCNNNVYIKKSYKKIIKKNYCKYLYNNIHIFYFNNTKSYYKWKYFSKYNFKNSRKRI